MSRTRPRPSIDPRGWSEFEAAAYIGRSADWLRDNRERLRAAGFPAPVDVLGRYDRAAIDRWFDRMSGMLNPSEDLKAGEDRLIGRARNGKDKGAVSDRPA